MRPNQPRPIPTIRSAKIPPSLAAGWQPLNASGERLASLLPTWLGLLAEAIGVGAIRRPLHVVSVHMGADRDHGPFTVLVASTRFHGWHPADTA